MRAAHVAVEEGEARALAGAEEELEPAGPPLGTAPVRRRALRTWHMGAAPRAALCHPPPDRTGDGLWVGRAAGRREAPLETPCLARADSLHRISTGT